ncbi:MAG: hypothetical protein R2844_21885 [Caldilineales bacterium]
MTSSAEILENAGGALMVATTVILRPLLAGRYRRWGATGDETTRTLPGDERVPAPLVTQTLAVTVNAPPADVWPWLAQIGQERGGMYSYELLENIARCQMHNADNVVPEWELQVGDLVRLGPPGYPVHKVVDMQRGRWLLLAGADLKTGEVPDPPKPGQAEYTNYSWVFFLQERPDGSTRLITRSHLDYAPRTFALKLIWEWFTDPIGFVMTRKMLLEIKKRAEMAPVRNPVAAT